MWPTRLLRARKKVADSGFSFLFRYKSLSLVAVVVERTLTRERLLSDVHRSSKSLRKPKPNDCSGDLRLGSERCGHRHQSSPGNNDGGDIVRT
jgi:hypothetical protein